MALSENSKANEMNIQKKGIKKKNGSNFHIKKCFLMFSGIVIQNWVFLFAWVFLRILMSGLCKQDGQWNVILGHNY